MTFLRFSMSNNPKVAKLVSNSCVKCCTNLNKITIFNHWQTVFRRNHFISLQNGRNRLHVEVNLVTNSMPNVSFFRNWKNLHFSGKLAVISRPLLPNGLTFPAKRSFTSFRLIGCKFAAEIASSLRPNWSLFCWQSWILLPKLLSTWFLKFCPRDFWLAQDNEFSLQRCLSRFNHWDFFVGLTKNLK